MKHLSLTHQSNKAVVIISPGFQVIDEYFCTNLNWGTVFINPNTGKAIDIYYFNYLYDLIGGTANKLSFISKHMTDSRYLYPYYDGKEPKEW